MHHISTMNDHHTICLLGYIFLLTSSGCGETIDPSEGGFSDVASYTAASGGTETGDPPKDDLGPGELDPGECIADAKEDGDVYGYKYQCGGYFMAHIGFSHKGDSYTFYIPELAQIPFGDGHEPYEQAKVMACCGLTDPDVDVWDQPPAYAENCLLDFRQQACISLATGLATLINDGTVPNAYKKKATAIQNYLADNTDECIQALLPDQSGLPNFLEQATWPLPDDGPWSSHLDDVYVQINFSVITDLHLPEEPDTCASLNYNNDYLFTPPPKPLNNDFDVTLEEANGSIVGSDRITGHAPFASLSTSCADPFCSVATFSTDGVDFAIDELSLYVDGDLRVTNGTDSESISNVRLELYGQAQGSITGGGGVPIVHGIPAGKAQFLVVGQAAGEWVTIPVLNATPIAAREFGGVWSLDAFALEYVDDRGSTWTITVGPSDWL